MGYDLKGINKWVNEKYWGGKRDKGENETLYFNLKLNVKTLKSKIKEYFPLTLFSNSMTV